MGFWKNLLNIGSIAAVPFTGGASLAGLGVGGALKAALPSIIGGVASGLAGGAQKGREAENNAAMNTALFNQRENQNVFQGGMDKANMDLKQRQFAQDSQSDAYLKSLKSALALNLKDASVNRPAGVPTIKYSGGLRPSAIGPEGMAAAKEMNKQAMMRLMGGEKFDALPTYEKVGAPQYQKPGWFENIMGGVGLGANAINSAMGAQEDRSAMQQYIEAIQKLSQPQQPQGGTVPPPPFVPPKPKGLDEPVM